MWELKGFDVHEQLSMYVQKTNKENDRTRKFWMITGDGNSPKVRHANRQDAICEAERLAKANPSIEFFVLESVELIMQPIGVVRQKL